MNKKTKSIIIGGLVSGIVYAGLMVGFDYYDGNEFKIWRFLWNFFFFGGVMSLLTGYNVRKQSENKDE